MIVMQIKVIVVVVVVVVISLYVGVFANLPYQSS